MNELVIHKMVDIGILAEFSCGIAMMDQFLHEGLQQSIDNHYCNAYYVTIGKDVVAMFALSYDSIDLDYDDKDELMNGISATASPSLSTEYIEVFYSKRRYPALDIAFLAVRNDLREQGIGEAIVRQIEVQARKQDFAGCQFISVEALCTKEYSAVNFYHKCGFAPNEYPNPSKDTLRMYKTLYAVNVEE